MGMCFISFALVITYTPQKLIALTFDDGPSIYTDQLLDGLAERNAHATFFMTGENGDGGTCGIKNGHEKVLERMLEEGHQLANHSYAHKDFDSLSQEEMELEVSLVDGLIREIAGEDYDCFVRIPGGHWNEDIANALPERAVVQWSLDSGDWKSRDANAVCSTIVNNAVAGDIVLLHDLYPSSIEGALQAIDALQAEGYEFVTVSDLLKRTNTEVENGVPICSALR